MNGGQSDEMPDPVAIGLLMNLCVKSLKGDGMWSLITSQLTSIACTDLVTELELANNITGGNFINQPLLKV